MPKPQSCDIRQKSEWCQCSLLNLVRLNKPWISPLNHIFDVNNIKNIDYHILSFIFSITILSFTYFYGFEQYRSFKHNNFINNWWWWCWLKNIVLPATNECHNLSRVWCEFKFVDISCSQIHKAVNSCMVTRRQLQFQFLFQLFNKLKLN